MNLIDLLINWIESRGYIKSDVCQDKYGLYQLKGFGMFSAPYIEIITIDRVIFLDILSDNIISIWTLDYNGVEERKYDQDLWAGDPNLLDTLNSIIPIHRN